MLALKSWMLMSMRNDHTCRLIGKVTIHIKMHDETIRELKEVRYIPSMMKNIISVGALKWVGLRGTLGKGALKMSSGSSVVLKDIRCNNVY